MKPSYEQLEQERNELAAQVERLQIAAATVECALSNSNFAVDGLDDLQEALDETPPAALSALKAQWQADILENISVAIASHDWFYAQKTPVQVATALLEESNRIRQRALEADDE